MNLTSFAPADFKKHLEDLENTIRFNKARIVHGLGLSNILQHYVLTGNDGAGMDDAVSVIHKLVCENFNISEYEKVSAEELFDSTDGFESSLKDVCQSNKMLYITHADALSMKGNVGRNNGIEVLCEKMSSAKNCIVALSGRRNRLIELIKGNEKANELFANIFHFDDLTPECMMEYVMDYANEHNYVLAPETEEKLKVYLDGVYKQRGTNFKNTIYLNNLLDKEIIPKMARRIMSHRDKGEDTDLCIIMPEDLPELSVPDAREAMEKLNSLVGLDAIKKQITDHTALVKLNRLRAEKGIYNKMPPMHMVFTGNPGTGKTTMAKYIGEIYHGIGVLSSGHLVETERSKLVGEFIGETEKKTLNTINSAAGGVLFIDEAYNLAEANNDGSKKDFGMRVIETLLTYLSAEDGDMIIILAGYTNEMTRMLESNPGMKSRFPYIFNFEDYTPDQLMQIGKNVLEEEHYTLSAEAEKKMAKYIIHEYENKDEHFGNGRFVTRLVKSHIIPAMSRRLLEKADSNLTMEELTTVEECDIPDVKNSEYTPKEMDEAILSEALERLNCMVGLRNAKQALRDYTTISKINHQQGLLKITPQNLCWDFIGKTGTGKSTVAEILGKILHGLGILKRGHTICINAEELMGTDSYLVLERVVKEAKDGLLFLDMDAPNTSNINLNHIRMWILNKIRENQQTTALVIAQIKASEDMIAQNLATHGIASYGNAVVFDDYTKQELFDILSFLLDKENHIGIEPEAGKTLQKYIENIKSSETKDSPVNARTILHLSQTIAHIAQLRLAQSGGERTVTTEDVAHFQWDGKTRGKVGYV